MSLLQSKLIKSVFLLPAIVFWIAYFTPRCCTEDYFKLFVELVAALLSVVSFLFSTGFLAVAKADAFWWLVGAVALSPLIAFFVCVGCWFEPYWRI